MLPINILAQPSSMPQIKSEVAVLIDADTGQVLYGKNQNARIYPASTTKIMTALLALERGNLSDIITMSYDAVWSIGRDTSHVALDENEQLNLEQALYALAIESANDAANGIAELIGGSMENFSGMMTKRAKELGANNTNFTNAHGLQDSNHYTSAYDLAIIMAEAVKIPEFTRMFTTVTYSMPPTNRQPETRTFN
ncbi:MAG: serine hydrolase, partial [Oscillospiraceae bacterium]|nr:serine hydrolase [Oscillospiraceae bacterium]